MSSKIEDTQKPFFPSLKAVGDLAAGLMDDGKTSVAFDYRLDAKTGKVSSNPVFYRWNGTAKTIDRSKKVDMPSSLKGFVDAGSTDGELANHLVDVVVQDYSLENRGNIFTAFSDHAIERAQQVSTRYQAFKSDLSTKEKESTAKTNRSSKAKKLQRQLTADVANMKGKLPDLHGYTQETVRAALAAQGYAVYSTHSTMKTALELLPDDWKTTLSVEDKSIVNTIITDLQAVEAGLCRSEDLFYQTVHKAGFSQGDFDVPLNTDAESKDIMRKAIVARMEASKALVEAENVSGWAEGRKQPWSKLFSIMSKPVPEHTEGSLTEPATVIVGSIEEVRSLGASVCRDPRSGSFYLQADGGTTIEVQDTVSRTGPIVVVENDESAAGNSQYQVLSGGRFLANHLGLRLNVNESDHRWLDGEACKSKFRLADDFKSQMVSAAVEGRQYTNNIASAMRSAFSSWSRQKAQLLVDQVHADQEGSDLGDFFKSNAVARRQQYVQSIKPELRTLCIKTVYDLNKALSSNHAELTEMLEIDLPDISEKERAFLHSLSYNIQADVMQIQRDLVSMGELSYPGMNTAQTNGEFDHAIRLSRANARLRQAYIRSQNWPWTYKEFITNRTAYREKMETVPLDPDTWLEAGTTLNKGKGNVVPQRIDPEDVCQTLAEFGAELGEVEIEMPSEAGEKDESVSVTQSEEAEEQYGEDEFDDEAFTQVSYRRKRDPNKEGTNHAGSSTGRTSTTGSERSVGRYRQNPHQPRTIRSPSSSNSSRHQAEFCSLDAGYNSIAARGPNHKPRPAQIPSSKPVRQPHLVKVSVSELKGQDDILDVWSSPFSSHKQERLWSLQRQLKFADSTVTAYSFAEYPFLPVELQEDKESTG